jgi:hypothetical protein
MPAPPLVREIGSPMPARLTNDERYMLDEIERESIPKRLGDDLITAAREAVDAWHAPGAALSSRRMHRALRRLEELVGRS